MLMARLSVVAVALAAAIGDGAGVNFPQYPFTRPLSVAGGESGLDVFLLQSLLARGARCAPPPRVTSAFNAATAACLAHFQASAPAPLPSSGSLDAATAAVVLSALGPDGYADDGRPPAATGHLYKVIITVEANRSVEATARLLDARGALLRAFTVRTHGADQYPPGPWPTWNSSGAGLNEFSDDGATPTGLCEFDLNSPEYNATEFGPFNINRAVRGLRGNWQILATGEPATMVRDGILMHTGAWPGWAPPQVMPNSQGCIHAWPEDIRAIADALAARGVAVRNNTNGSLPYPFRPQGLLSVQCPSCQPAWR